MAIPDADPDRVVLAIYASLTLGAAFINSIQIRIPNFRKYFIARVVEWRRRFIQMLSEQMRIEPVSKYLVELDKVVTRLEESLDNVLDAVERDYEKRYGYVCITFALLSVSLSYALLGIYTAYGIIALAVVDSVSAVITALAPRPRLGKHSVPSIIATYTIFTALLYTITRNLGLSLSLSLVAIVVELLSPEDNLTLPIIVSFIAWILRAPAIL